MESILEFITLEHRIEHDLEHDLEHKKQFSAPIKFYMPALSLQTSFSAFPDNNSEVGNFQNP